MTKMIVLAAGQGSRLRPLTDDRPKCMVPLHGQPLLHWNVQAARAAGIDDVVIVGGYRSDRLGLDGARLVLNEEFATSNMVFTLFKAGAEFGDGFVMAYGDIVYRPEVMRALLESKDDIAVISDRRWLDYWKKRCDDPLSDAESFAVGADGNVRSIGKKVKTTDEIQGQYIGLVKYSAAGLRAIRTFADREQALNKEGKTQLAPGKTFRSMYMTDLLQGVIDQSLCAVRPVWIDGGWLEVDCPEDLQLAEQLTRCEGAGLSIDR